MLRRGDLLLLREREWLPGDDTVLVTILAVGATRHENGDWWTAVKAAQTTWRKEPAVRFIKVRAASIRTASERTWGRVGALVTGRCPVGQVEVGNYGQ